MDEKINTTYYILLNLVILSLFCLGSTYQARAYQDIESWFHNNKNTTETEKALRKSRQNAITHAISVASPIVACISVTSVSMPEGSDKHTYFSELENRGALEKIGSGFILQKDGTLVTNAHILDYPFENIIVSFKNGNSYLAKVIGRDSLTNIALLKIDTDQQSDFPSATLGNSNDVLVGEWSIAMGNPFGLMENGSPTASVGVISGNNISYQQNSNQAYFDMIQTDAVIEKYNSGGPLVNSSGHIIGMNTHIPSRTDSNEESYQGNRYAIPINRIVHIANVLENPDAALPFDPGFSYTTIDTKLSKELDLRAGNGLLVTKVHVNSPAYEAGLMPGDIIIKFGSTHAQSDVHAQALLQQYEIGDDLPIELLRDDKKYRTSMTLRAKIELKNGDQ